MKQYKFLLFLLVQLPLFSFSINSQKTFDLSFLALTNHTGFRHHSTAGVSLINNVTENFTPQHYNMVAEGILQSIGVLKTAVWSLGIFTKNTVVKT